MTPIDMDLGARLESDIDTWLAEAEKVVEQYPRIKATRAALRGEVYVEHQPEPDISPAVVKAQARIEELEEQRDAIQKVSDGLQDRVLELEAIKLDVPVTRKPDPWALPDMPEHYESYALRRNKGIGSEATFITLPDTILSGYSVGDMFAVVREGDTIYLMRDHILGRKEGSVEPEGEPEAEPAAEPAEEKVAKQRVRITVEELRDWAIKLGRPFGRKEIMDEFDISTTTAGHKIASLVEKGIFTVAMIPNPGTPPREEYTYVKPHGPQPTHHPVQDRPNNGSRANQIPGTGKPAGPAETPGKLKRQQKKAQRVKHKPVKGVRV